MSEPPQTFIIAEAGVNHNGSLELALKLVTTAKEAGADAVKFQTFGADRLVTRRAAKAAYQKSALPGDDSQFAMLKALELGEEDFRRISRHCRRLGIEFLSSPFDTQAVDLLDRLGLLVFKIPSGEITNLPLLRHVGGMKKEVILSTGASWLGEVETAVRTLQDAGATRLTLLHCVTEYPAPPGQVNLRAMDTLRTTFGLPVGYSDHTSGVEIPIAAVARGASVIEKHFTLDTNMHGPDHSASLDPDDFARMVSAIRTVETALGDGLKRPAACETENRDIVRKSVVAARDLPAGTRLTSDDLALKRPGGGLSPAALEGILGRTTRRNVAAEELLDWSLLE